MKVERLSKSDLVAHCRSIGIDPAKKTKPQLLAEIESYRQDYIQKVKAAGRSHLVLQEEIKQLAQRYSDNLKVKIEDRKQEMAQDDTSRYLIYQVLGITAGEGKLIDEYQNTGRFLYTYAGSFLEEAASLCLEYKNPQGKKTFVANTLGARPKTFEIDFLDGINAIEIKWRDATTDGDHISKERTRVECIRKHGYIPIRVMFYYPQRARAQRIQERLQTIYTEVQGKYYAGESAWDFIKEYSGTDLKAILNAIENQTHP